MSYDIGHGKTVNVSRAEQIRWDAMLARELANDPHADFDTAKQRLFGTASFAESPTRASAAAAAASVTAHDTSSAAASAAARPPSSCPFQAAHNASASGAAVPPMRTGLSATEIDGLDSSSASASASTPVY